VTAARETGRSSESSFERRAGSRQTSSVSAHGRRRSVSRRSFCGRIATSRRAAHVRRQPRGLKTRSRTRSGGPECTPERVGETPSSGSSSMGVKTSPRAARARKSAPSRTVPGLLCTRATYGQQIQARLARTPRRYGCTRYCFRAVARSRVIRDRGLPLMQRRLEARRGLDLRPGPTRSRPGRDLRLGFR